MTYLESYSPFGNLYNFRIARSYVVGSPVNNCCYRRSMCKKNKRRRRKSRK